MTGRITALEPQKRSRDRVNVYLDGAFAFGLASFVAANLSVGKQLTDEAIAELKAADGLERAHSRALDYLSYRPRSEAEVREYLLDKASPTGDPFSEDVIEEVLGRLTRAGLVDDAEFAQYWCENRARFRPRGKRMLRYELRQKGVSSYDIDAALDAYDEATAIQKLAREQARRLAHLPPDTARRRLYGRLTRRGFSGYLIQETLDALETSQDALGAPQDLLEAPQDLLEAPAAQDFPQLTDQLNEED